MPVLNSGCGRAGGCYHLHDAPPDFQFSSFFHAIVAGFAVQRRPCWVGLGGGEEGLQKRCDFGFDWVKTRYIIQGCAESSELLETVACEESAKTFELTGY